MTWRRGVPVPGQSALKANNPALRGSSLRLRSSRQLGAATGRRAGRWVIRSLAGIRRVIVDAGVVATAWARVLAGSGASMIPISSALRIWIATGHTDMRKGMQGLSLLVQESLGVVIRSPGDVFVFRGRKRFADQGLMARRNWIVALRQSEFGPWASFVWPVTVGGVGGADTRRRWSSSAGGDRLAQPAAHVAAAERRLGSKMF